MQEKYLRLKDNKNTTLERQFLVNTRYYWQLATKRLPTDVKESCIPVLDQGMEWKDILYFRNPLCTISWGLSLTYC